MCEDQFVRMIIKLGEGVPTIPVSADHRNGDWIANDIYEGEFYQDTLTGIIYNRTGSLIGAVGSVPTQIVLNRTEVQALGSTYGTGYTLITVPVGYGARFTKPPILKNDDDGTVFVFSSGEYLNIIGNGGTLPTMAQFSDPCVTSPATYSASFFFSYEMTGNVVLTATIPITGGGVNATFTLTLDYELFLL